MSCRERHDQSDISRQNVPAFSDRGGVFKAKTLFGEAVDDLVADMTKALVA